MKNEYRIKLKFLRENQSIQWKFIKLYLTVSRFAVFELPRISRPKPFSEEERRNNYGRTKAGRPRKQPRLSLVGPLRWTALPRGDGILFLLLDIVLSTKVSLTVDDILIIYLSSGDRTIGIPILLPSSNGSIRLEDIGFEKSYILVNKWFRASSWAFRFYGSRLPI